MLDYETAMALYEAITNKVSTCGGDEEFLEFYTEFLKSASDYAAIRTDWHFMNTSQRVEQDQRRSKVHDGYMSYLLAVCRNLGVENVDTILPDRKAKGDFACYIVLFLALGQR